MEAYCTIRIDSNTMMTTTEKNNDKKSTNQFHRQDKEDLPHLCQKNENEPTNNGLLLYHIDEIIRGQHQQQQQQQQQQLQQLDDDNSLDDGASLHSLDVASFLLQDKMDNDDDFAGDASTTLREDIVGNNNNNNNNKHQQQPQTTTERNASSCRCDDGKGNDAPASSPRVGSRKSVPLRVRFRQKQRGPGRRSQLGLCEIVDFVPDYCTLSLRYPTTYAEGYEYDEIPWFGSLHAHEEDTAADEEELVTKLCQKVLRAGCYDTKQQALQLEANVRKYAVIMKNQATDCVGVNSTHPLFVAPENDQGQRGKQPPSTADADNNLGSGTEPPVPALPAKSLGRGTKWSPKTRLRPRPTRLLSRQRSRQPGATENEETSTIPSLHGATNNNVNGNNGEDDSTHNNNNSNDAENDSRRATIASPIRNNTPKKKKLSRQMTWSNTKPRPRPRPRRTRHMVTEKEKKEITATPCTDDANNDDDHNSSTTPTNGTHQQQYKKHSSNHAKNNKSKRITIRAPLIRRYSASTA